MERFEKVCKVSEVPQNSMKGFKVKDKDILVSNLNGEFFAIDSICSHMNGYLPRGKLKGNCVVCPVHHAEFDVKTGRVTKDLPWLLKKMTKHDVTDLVKYETKLVNDEILVKV